jgi:beta-lactamase class A
MKPPARHRYTLLIHHTMKLFNSEFFTNNKKGLITLNILILIGFILMVPGGRWTSEKEVRLYEIVDTSVNQEISSAVNDTWITGLEKQIRQLDQNMAGDLGVYIKISGDSLSLGYNADSYWYLSSTIKVPLAIAVLQKVENGEISLGDEIILQESDFVDGAGDLLRQKPGTSYTVAELIEKMVKDSDSSATDMLMRLLGEEEFNMQIRQSMVPDGFNRITPILQVRYDAYSEFHENASRLSNLDIIYVHSTRSRPERLKRLIERMAINETDLKAKSIEEAFKLYYRRELNSSTLEAFGILLERLQNGELLSDEHTDFLLKIMESITTGDRRIKAGLPGNVRFAQKTGTQIESACNVGIIYPESTKGIQPVIIAACVRDFGDIAEAEKTFEYIARLIANTLF